MAPTNRVESLRPLIPALLRALETLAPRQLFESVSGRFLEQRVPAFANCDHPCHSNLRQLWRDDRARFDFLGATTIATMLQRGQPTQATRIVTRRRASTDFAVSTCPHGKR